MLLLATEIPVLDIFGLSVPPPVSYSPLLGLVLAGVTIATVVVWSQRVRVLDP
jgi:hypothetical protein